jgi:hypothetical protein
MEPRAISLESIESGWSFHFPQATVESNTPFGDAAVTDAAKTVSTIPYHAEMKGEIRIVRSYPAA